MSQGTSCKCPEAKKPIDQRRWVVLQRYGNCSAFNGYRWQSSDYSSVQCHACGTVWRTKADYVAHLKDGKNVYDLPADQWPSGHTPIPAQPALSDGARKALERPANYADLPADEQWAIDKKLGILDWDGK